MNGDDKAGTKLEQEREKEPGRYFTTFMNGNCSGLQCSETKKKETNKKRC